MIQDTQRSVIDFANYISEQTEDFTGREWVFQAVNDWLTTPGESRFLLLTGEPGSGKTAIASRLAQISQGSVAPSLSLTSLTPHFLSALHFCSARDSRWIIPYVFAESLALQLAERYPAYAKALAEKSGDRQIHIEVQQHIEQGQGIGVVINRLDVSGVPPEDAFNRVVREPLEALFRDGFDQQIVILIDGLDEALEYSGSRNIISLLTRIYELPPTVRFLLTSRSDVRVVNAFQEADELALSDTINDQYNQEDIRRYVKERLGSDEKLAMKAAKLDAEYVSKKIMETLVRKAEGNFLYTRFLLDAIAGGKRSLTDLEGLPEGLDGLYLESLRRVVPLGKEEKWHNDYAPLMGMLSVAQESLTEAQLQAFSGQPKTSVWQCLSDLQQFIKEIKILNETGEQESRYRLYHQSIVDFLNRQRLLKKQLPNLFYLPSTDWHKYLADGCEKNDIASIWKNVKLDPVEQGRRTYARRHYITHLFYASDMERLLTVLEAGEYGRAKLLYDPSTRSYAYDLDFGRRAAAWSGWTLEKSLFYLPYLWRYTLLRVSLSSQVDDYPIELFQTLLLLGRERETLEFAELLTQLDQKAKVLLLIAQHFVGTKTHQTEGQKLFLRAYDIITSIEQNDRKATLLCKLLNILVSMQQQELAGRVEKEIIEITHIIERDSNDSWLLLSLASALAEAQLWEQTEQIARSIQSEYDKASALYNLSSALTKAQQWEQAEKIALSIEQNDKKVRALNALVRALFKAQRQREADILWQETRKVARSLTEQGRKARALSELASVLAEAQVWSAAERLWDEAQVAASTSGEKAYVLHTMVRALAESQQWGRAVETVNSIENPLDKANALYDLGKAFVKTQQWGNAETIVHNFKGPFTSQQKFELQCALADSLVEAQQWERAERIWQETRELIHTFKGSNEDFIFFEVITGGYGYAWNNALHRLASALARARQWEQAENIALSIKENNEKAGALCDLASILIWAQQRNRAKRIWNEAQKSVHSIEADFKQAEALHALATALIEARQWKRAAKIVNSIDDESNEKAQASCELASAFAKAHQWKEAFQIIHSIKFTTEQANALYALANALAEAQQWKQAKKVWLEGQRIMYSLQESSKEASTKPTFTSILDTNLRSLMQFLLGQFSSLTHLRIASQKASWYDEWNALWKVEEGVGIPIPGWKSHIRSVLINALARVHQWDQAEQIAWSIEENDEKAEALCAFADALTQAQQWERAEQISYSVEKVFKKSEALHTLVIALAKAQHWERVENIANSITESERRKTLSELTDILLSHGRYEQVLSIVQRSWLEVVTRDDALATFSLVEGLIVRRPKMGMRFYETFQWVNAFLDHA